MARILIVDDNAIDQRLVSGLLTKQLEVDILFAWDGTEALTKIAEIEPDLVLTDLNMPQMNGLDLVAQMRENYPLIPVIMMTAAGSEQIAVQAITAGASSYVSKRRLSQDLCDTAKHVLELSGERRTQSLIQQRQQRWETSLVVENDFALVTGVASYLMQNLRGMDVCAPAEEVRIGVAIAEALMNAYFHGNLEVPSLPGRDPLRNNARLFLGHRFDAILLSGREFWFSTYRVGVVERKAPSSNSRSTG